MPSINPTNTRHGGVGLFFKNSLPIKIRNDLSFDESIVIEFNLNRNNFFAVIYRSPTFNQTSPEIMYFLLNFNDLFQNQKRKFIYTPFYWGF